MNTRQTKSKDEKQPQKLYHTQSIKARLQHISTKTTQQNRSNHEKRPQWHTFQAHNFKTKISTHISKPHTRTKMRDEQPENQPHEVHEDKSNHTITARTTRNEHNEVKNIRSQHQSQFSTHIRQDHAPDQSRETNNPKINKHGVDKNQPTGTNTAHPTTPIIVTSRQAS